VENLQIAFNDAGRNGSLGVGLARAGKDGNYRS
jgi:hypothetical protein